MSQNKLTLRSYRLAFELERRIHRIDRFRIPVPYGIPLAGLGYACAAALSIALTARVPGMAEIVGTVPLPVRYLAVPVLTAHVLCRRRSDGRPAHEAIAARLVRCVRPQCLVAFMSPSRADRVAFASFVVVPDEAGPTYRRGVVRGPAVAVLRIPARAEQRGKALVVRQLGGPPLYRARELRLGEVQRLQLR